VADMGVTGQLYLAIAATYDGNESVVLTSDEQVASGSYDVNDGLREGGRGGPVVLSSCRLRLYNNIFMAGLVSHERLRRRSLVTAHLLTGSDAPLLGTRRRRCAATSCGLRAPPLYIGVPCVAYIHMHRPAAVVS
jgi:hypothetical protein